MYELMMDLEQFIKRTMIILTISEKKGIALKDILKFKRLSHLTSSPLDILECIQIHGALCFNVSPDGTRIQKATSFDSKSLEKEAILRALASSQTLIASGFPSTTPYEQVKLFFTSIADGSSISRLERGHKDGEWEVDFDKAEDLIQVLAKSNLLFEEHYAIHLSTKT
jgi:hypothetical protein